jgi:hypothetical protein
MAYNAALRRLAARFPKVATVIDLNRLLDPDGVYTTTIGGITVRWTDGVHITAAGGELIQPEVEPTLVTLGLAVEHTRSR